MKVLKRKLPLGAVALLLVLALAAIGLVYGNWSQTLNIGGTVTTGAVSAEWELPVLGAGPAAIPNPFCIDNEQARGVKEFGETMQDAKGKTLNVTIDDAYPNYGGNCEWHIRYTGQVPGVVEGITFDSKDLTNCGPPDPTGNGGFLVICDELVVQWVNGLCDVMQDGDLIGGSLIISVGKDANGIGPPEKATLGFNMTVDVVQWDKTTCT